MASRKTKKGWNSDFVKFCANLSFHPQPRPQCIYFNVCYKSHPLYDQTWVQVLCFPCCADISNVLHLIGPCYLLDNIKCHPYWPSSPQNSVQAIFSSRPSLNSHGLPEWGSHLEPMTTCYTVEFIFEKYLCYWFLHQFKLMKKTILHLSEF
jgi:hypothetical protein